MASCGEKGGGEEPVEHLVVSVSHTEEQIFVDVGTILNYLLLEQAKELKDI